MKKVAGVTGYQVCYSTSKAFKKNVKYKKVSASKGKITLKKLKKGKKYYFKVRPYTKVTDKTMGKSSIVYGKYSNVKKAKIKK